MGPKENLQVVAWELGRWAEGGLVNRKGRTGASAWVMNSQDPCASASGRGSREWGLPEGGGVFRGESRRMPWRGLSPESGLPGRGHKGSSEGGNGSFLGAEGGLGGSWAADRSGPATLLKAFY